MSHDAGTGTYSADEFREAAYYEETFAKKADFAFDSDQIAARHRLHAAALHIAARVMKPGFIEQQLLEDAPFDMTAWPEYVSRFGQDIRAALTKDTGK